MELDELKRSWQSLELKATTTDAEKAKLRKDLHSNKAQNLTGRLMKTSKRLVIISLLTMVCFLIFHCYVSLFGWYRFVAAALLLMCAVERAWMYYRLKHTDYLSLPLRQAILRTASLEKLRITERRVNFIVGIPVVIGMFYFIAINAEIDARTELLISGVIGGLVGGIIGIKIERTERKIIREIKSLLDELNDDADDESEVDKISE